MQNLDPEFVLCYKISYVTNKPAYYVPADISRTSHSYLMNLPSYQNPTSLEPSIPGRISETRSRSATQSPPRYPERSPGPVTPLNHFYGDFYRGRGRRKV